MSEKGCNHNFVAVDNKPIWECDICGMSPWASYLQTKEYYQKACFEISDLTRQLEDWREKYHFWHSKWLETQAQLTRYMEALEEIAGMDLSHETNIMRRDIATEALKEGGE